MRVFVVIFNIFLDTVGLRNQAIGGRIWIKLAVSIEGDISKSSIKITHHIL